MGGYGGAAQGARGLRTITICAQVPHACRAMWPACFACTQYSLLDCKTSSQHPQTAIASQLQAARSLRFTACMPLPQTHLPSARLPLPPPARRHTPRPGGVLGAVGQGEYHTFEVRGYESGGVQLGDKPPGSLRPRYWLMTCAAWLTGPEQFHSEFGQLPTLVQPEPQLTCVVPDLLCGTAC